MKPLHIKASPLLVFVLLLVATGTGFTPTASSNAPAADGTEPQADSSQARVHLAQSGQRIENIMNRDDFNCMMNRTRGDHFRTESMRLDPIA